MSKTLTQFRTEIRTHLEMDSDELVDSVIDQGVRGASEFIHVKDQRWPFFETEWTLTTIAGQPSYAYSALDTAELVGAVEPVINDPILLVGPSWPLEFTSRANILRTTINGATTGTPRYWGRFAQKIILYPTPDAVEQITVLGYRQGIDWVSQGAGAMSDLPTEFDSVIQYWAMGDCYAQQGESAFATYYKDLANLHLERLQMRYVDSPPLDRVIVNGGYRGRSSLRPSFPGGY